MILSNSKDTIELKVVGYEFPNTPKKSGDSYFDDDANWLEIYCKKTIDNETNSSTEPCLLTTEIKELLEAYKEKRIKSIGFEGMEPNFELGLSSKNEKDILEIKFWCESNKTITDNGKYFKKVVTEEDIQIIYDFFSQAIEKFPER